MSATSAAEGTNTYSGKPERTSSKSFSEAMNRRSSSSARSSQTRKSEVWQLRRPSTQSAQHTQIHRETTANPRVQLNVKQPSSTPAPELATSVEDKLEVKRVSERLREVSSLPEPRSSNSPSSPSIGASTPPSPKLETTSNSDSSEKPREGPPPPPPRPPALPEKTAADYKIILDPADPIPEAHKSSVKQYPWKKFNPNDKRIEKTPSETFLDEESPSLSPRDVYPSKKDLYGNLIKSNWEEIGNVITREEKSQRNWSRKASPNKHDDRETVPKLDLNKTSKFHAEEEQERESARSYLEQLASLRWANSEVGLSSCLKCYKNDSAKAGMRLVSPRPGAVPRFVSSPSKNGGTSKTPAVSTQSESSRLPPIVGLETSAKNAFTSTVISAAPQGTTVRSTTTATNSRQPSTSLLVGGSQKVDVNELELFGQPDVSPMITSPEKYKKADGNFDNGTNRRILNRLKQQHTTKAKDLITSVYTDVPNRESTQSNSSILSKNSGQMKFLSAQDETAFRRDERTVERLYGHRPRT